MKNIYKLLIVMFAAIAFAACSDDKEDALEVTYGNLVTEISINASGNEIVLADAGDIATVSVSAQPTNADDLGNYDFLSSDQKIFTVDSDGLITATGPGTAILTVVSKNNAKVTANCNVLVVGTRITSIGINDTYKEYTVTRTNAAGPSFNLLSQLTILPVEANIKLLKFTSSDPTVATVTENGVVTALWKGQTQIKAEATDGSGIFAICNLTVNITPITSITVGANIQTVYYNNLFNGTNDETLSATITRGTANANRFTVLPTNATRNILNYTSSNTSILAIEPDVSNNLVVTPLSKGTATIQIDATDDSEVSAQIQVVVYGMLDRNSWSISGSSAAGSVSEANGDTWGGPISNIIRDGDAAGLIKAGAPGGPAVGEDVYFVVDMGQAKAFDYVAVSGTWSGGINSGVKINQISLLGSNDGNSFTPLETGLSVSTGQYNTYLRLAASYSYRYVKVVVTNPSTLYNAAGSTNQRVTHYVIKDFRLGSSI